MIFDVFLYSFATFIATESDWRVSDGFELVILQFSHVYDQSGTLLMNLTQFCYVHNTFGKRFDNFGKSFDTLFRFQDDGHLSDDGSTMASDDEWETASGESTEEESPADIMDHVLRSSSSASDERTENVDREVLQEANNRINEIMSNTNPGTLS